MLYQRSTEIRELAQEMIFDKAYRLDHLIGETIIFLAYDEAKGQKAVEWGRTQKLTGLPAAYAKGRLAEDYGWTDPQEAEGFQIMINWMLWVAAGPEHRRQVLYHYLLRCHVDEEGKTEVRQPDMVIFREEIARFGADLPSVQSVLNALSKQAQMDFEEDENGARAHGQDPEPLSLPSPMAGGGSVAIDAEFTVREGIVA